MWLGIDPLYWLMMAPIFLLSLFSSFSVKSAYSQFSRYTTRAGLTGAQVARQLLKVNGITDVVVNETRGFLSDHYDPVKKVIRLSPDVYHRRSISAIGVAAHETGHAIQHATSYSPLVFRNMMVPVASIGSNFAYIIIIMGFVLGMLGVIKLGIILFSAVVVFQVLTLPVEFNASSRAKTQLARFGLVNKQELEGVNKVLSAAAMTYVAAAASSIMTLLYFLLRSGILGGRDD